MPRRKPTAVAGVAAALGAALLLTAPAAHAQTQRQENKNLSRNAAYTLGGAAILSALSDNGGAAVLFTLGAGAAGYEYERNRRMQSQENQDRLSLNLPPSRREARLSKRLTLPALREESTVVTGEYSPLQAALARTGASTTWYQTAGSWQNFEPLRLSATSR